MKYSVEIYISKVKLCTNCFRHGHTKNICKSKGRCIYCGDTTHEENVCTKPKENTPCVNCNDNHLPTDRACQATKIEQNIIKMAVRKNLTIQEAKNNYKEQLLNKKRFKFSDFPELTESFSPNEITDSPYINTTPKRHLFSNVVKETPHKNRSPSPRNSPCLNASNKTKEEHKALLIATNGNYNLHIKHPNINQLDEQPLGSSQAETAPRITLLENGYLISNSFITHKQILNYLVNDSNFYDIFKKTY